MKRNWWFNDQDCIKFDVIWLILASSMTMMVSDFDLRVENCVVELTLDYFEK